MGVCVCEGVGVDSVDWIDRMIESIWKGGFHPSILSIHPKKSPPHTSNPPPAAFRPCRDPLPPIAHLHTHARNTHITSSSVASVDLNARPPCCCTPPSKRARREEEEEEAARRRAAAAAVREGRRSMVAVGVCLAVNERGRALTSCLVSGERGRLARPPP